MEAQASQQDAAKLVRVGGWLFRHRSWLPLPIILVLLALPARAITAAEWLLGGFIVAAGEALRLWGVHHIGVISRTRSDRLGPLVASGPFAFVRNPLYLGNIALWDGFAVCAGLAWLVPFITVLLGFEYHAIVRWEEGLLEARLGDAYRRYAQLVPRWIPNGRTLHGDREPPAAPARGFSWRDTLFSERGTLLAIAAGYALLWLKSTI